MYKKWNGKEITKAMNNALNPGCPFLNILSQSLTVHFFLSAPLPPSLPVLPCLLHLLPVLLYPTLAVRMTESYPSCHRKGNVRELQGGNRGQRWDDVTSHLRLCTGLPWHLQAPCSVPKIHLLYVGLSVHTPQYQMHGCSQGSVTKNCLHDRLDPQLSAYSWATGYVWAVDVVNTQ